MIDANINNPKSPKYYVRKYLEERSSELKGKMVVDFPAGNGATSELLYQLGATVYAFDLFPQYFLFDKIKCTQANIENGIPLNDEFADIVICQEGIEHFNNVYFAFREFNRILKNDGTLIITTPSYSNIASKVSYLLFESETFQRMPPNEWDDIWMSDNEQRIYFGHLFLIGLQKLRTLATLSGFELIDSRFMRLSKGSLFLFPFFYPFILLSSYTRFLNKKIKLRKHPQRDIILSIYLQQLRLNISIKELLNKHTFLILRKICNSEDFSHNNNENYKPFGKIM